ncbi:MAG: hypothetical protein K8S23_06600 [Candidatus Cloacimonetes bacterium]|nr:hypothetical protein [Candidatus Cloacimonadota bacterium]
MSKKTCYLFILILIAVSAFADSPGNCLDFDGTDDYVNCGNSTELNITTNITIEAWVYYEGGETFPRIIDKYPAPSIYIAESSDQVGWYGEVNGVARDFIFSGALVPRNEWTHVAVTYDGSGIKAYINGSLESTENYSGHLTVTTNNLLIGNNTTENRTFGGKIDEVRLWDSARSQSEISNNMRQQLSGTESNLVSYWMFDENSGTTAFDTAGSSDGTLTNMDSSAWTNSTVPFISDTTGYTLNFDGTNDYVDCGNDPSLDITNSIAIEAWIKAESWAPYIWGGTILSKGGSGNTGYVLRCGDNGSLNFVLGMNTGWVYTSSSAIMQIGEWNHIAGVYNGSSLRLYINGEIVDEQFVSGDIGVSPNNIYIGESPQYPNRYFQGQIDEVRIWNAARTQIELNHTMHTSLTGNEANLVSYYQFNAGEELIAYDMVSANNGTMTNMTEDDWVPSDVPFGVIVNGTISTDTIWDDELVIVTGDITVNQGVSLTVNPGTTVFFTGEYSLTINGKMLAIGTEAEMISFTSSEGVHWKSVLFIPDDNLCVFELEYCIFENAYLDNNEPGREGGGAVYIEAIDDYEISIKNCLFQNNRAEKGGAIYVRAFDSGFVNNTFSNNNAEYGGAIYFGDYSDYNHVMHCVFKDNSAVQSGGAIYVEFEQAIVSCLFFDNESISGPGGAIFYDGGFGSLINCTITENSAPAGAGVAFNNGSPQIANCIVYGNVANDNSQINIIGTNWQPSFLNCLIEGGKAAFSGDSFNRYYGDCKDYDPEFTDPVNNDYTLTSVSPCINAGHIETSFYLNDWIIEIELDPLTRNIDLDGNDRFFDEVDTQSGDLDLSLDCIDMGAYEYSYSSGIIGATYYEGGGDAAVIPIDIHIAKGVTYGMGGETWKFQNGASLYIHGQLEVEEWVLYEYSTVYRTTFQPYDEFSDFGGLHFVSTDPTATSQLKYCIVDGGIGNAGIESEYGGNISVYNYNEVIIENCIIRNGSGQKGGGIYSKNSSLILRNTVLSDNEASVSGGGLFSDNSDVSIINCTIGGNSSSSDGSGLRFESIGTQPQIINSIIWDNEANPIYPVGSALTNVTYSDIDVYYAGQGNISVDPQFKITGEHPYGIEGGSYCINAGIPDTIGLNFPDYDIYGNYRIFAHTTSSYDRIDIGAYEVPGILAPSPFTASDGNNDFHGYVQLNWEFNNPDPNWNPTPIQFRILRNGVNINTIDANTFFYQDDTAIPGVIYSYVVQTIADEQTGNSAENSGFIKPNGIITGTVLTTNNNPVEDVKVYLNPSTGYCLEFDSANSSQFITESPAVDMDLDFTIELWVKTLMSNIVLMNKGDHNFSVNSSGNLEYTDGMNTLVQSSRTNVNDGDWHHIALVSDAMNLMSTLYLDEVIVASNTGFAFSGSSDEGFSSSLSFTGYLDDLRIWSTARDSSDIVDRMDITASIDNEDLAGYWALNEGVGNTAYDATDYAHHGSISNCDWSANEPGILLGSFTDSWGEYIIRDIAYGYATTFQVIPFKSGHLFQPELRNVTISESNIAQNGIDFTDNSLVPISGHVLYQNTLVPVAGATILLNGQTATPPTFTNEEGYYVLEVEHGTQSIVSVDYEDHIFNREWHLGAVTFPQVNKDFEDTFKVDFRLDVVGGNDSYPIGDFEVTLQSVNGYYNDLITGEDWSSGGILVSALPPIDYNVTVDPIGLDPFNLVLDEQFQNIKTDLITLSQVDSTLDSLRFVWKAPLEISVAWSDTLNLYSFPEYPESEFYVLEQNIWADVAIQAFEDYSYVDHPDQVTYLDNCEIVISDDVGTQGTTETAFQDSTTFTYTFAPYLPNMLSGYNRQYQKQISFTIQDSDLNRYCSQIDWVLTEGARPQETTYSSTSPDIPFMILHDPPGDGSYATFDESSYISYSFDIAACTDSEHSLYSTLHLGNNFTASIGSIFFSVESKVEVIVDMDLGFSRRVVQNDSNQYEYTMTTTESYSTSSDDQLIGRRSDLFVGGAINLIWGTTHDLAWDNLTQDVIIDTSVMVTPNGFETVYVYTENQIRNTVIPNLETIGDTASVTLWQGFLDANEDNIDFAVSNPNHPENVSFNAGASYSYTETTNRDYTESVTFETILDYEAASTIGLVVNGHGVEGGYAFSTIISNKRNYTDGEGTSTKTSFTLADDDETSDLNFLADYFTVDIKQDTVYGTPVFNLLSGASSCPWEPETLPREGVSFTATPSSVNGLLPGEQAVFLLSLGNTSQTNEYRRYYLTQNMTANPGGAVIRVNGSILGGTMTFDVPAGEVAEAIMTVSQGPLAYEYENLTLEFYTTGDRGHEGPEGHDFYVFKEFDVYWEPPYSRVSIDSPSDNWILNQANDDTLDIFLTDYDLTKPDFASIKLQYKHPQDENWLPAFEIFRDSLESSHPHYIEVPWDVSGISDGLYEIRAATTDSVQADYYTESLSGIIDRTAPILFNQPEPQDEILEPGDEILLTFVETIDPASINPSNFSLEVISTGMQIGIDITCVDNMVNLTPNIANFWFENETLEAEVSGLRDLYGNTMEAPITWEFYVNSNPVNWNVTKLDVIKPLGESMTLTANLINDGGQYYSYVFTDYADSLYHPLLQYHTPDWLSITPTSGQLIPLDSQEISFEISDQIGFGHYETIIYAHTPMGNEAIEIEVDVLSNPPDWTITEFNNFQSSMSIIGELNIEGGLSVDTNDIIGAFMQEESGDWVCRGVANIEAIPYIPTHPYQVFLTIYSDLDDPVRTEDEIIFRVWDNSDNKEYYQVDHSVFGGTLMYLANEVYGTPLNPISLATVNDMVQDIPLNSGWTWFSTNLDLVPNTINDVLGSLSPINADLIKAQTQYSQYLTDSWLGTLSSLNNTSMYKIKMAEAQNLEIIGELRDPVTTTISYSTGWNWIGYIPHVSMSVNEALSDRTNTAGDFIKNQAGYAFYVDSDIGWIGSLRFMNPDEGFMLYSSGTGSFEYPEYIIRSKNDYPDLTPLVLRDAPDWSVNPQDFEYTASVTIELLINEIPATSGNYMVGAFVGEECRGSVTSIPVLDTYLYFLTVFSNTQNEEISLKVYDADADEIIDPAHSFTFNNDLILGSPSTPYELEIAGALDIPQNVIIEIIGTDVQISWDEVAGANSYKIYASDDSEETFVDVTGSGSFGSTRSQERLELIQPKGVRLEHFDSQSNSSFLTRPDLSGQVKPDKNRATQTWTASITVEKKFYYVVASTE